VFEPNRILHRNEILATGVDGPGITELVALGILTRLWRGFYTTGTPIGSPDPRGVTKSMRVVLSHESAAAWSGVRVTRPNRTIADVARSCSLERAVCVADGYLRKRLTTMSSLRAYAFNLAGPRRALAMKVASLSDPGSASVFETLTRLLLARAGLPAPITQYDVHDQDGTWIGRVDFAWPEAGLILECDGFEHHSTREAFHRDRRRWSALSRAGWAVRVVTWHDLVNDPEYVIRLVADHLAAT
jgi:hypothetical protein